MMQLPDSQAGNINTESRSEPVSNLLLLDGRQWSYVQSRYNLTPREREIAELICQGLRSCNIARNLRIKNGTVKTHTRNIYRKVRVKSKIAMLLRFVSDTRELSVS
ncbi:MAG: response regulator transcription factor [Sedimentisphaerales bacterium]|nr:response regulator transcription factor [Sedimentisphaerales bacterium]